MHLTRRGVPSLTAVTATASIEMRLRETWITTIASPLTRRPSSISQFLALPKSLSMLHRFRNSLTTRLDPLATKSLPTLRALLAFESLLTGIIGSAPSHSAAFRTFSLLYWLSATTVLNPTPRLRALSSSGSKWSLSLSLHGATVYAMGSSESAQQTVCTRYPSTNPFLPLPTLASGSLLPETLSMALPLYASMWVLSTATTFPIMAPDSMSVLASRLNISW